MKKHLEKKLARLQAKKNDLVTRCNASQDVAEVRSLTAQMEDINAEIEEIREMLAEIEAEEARAKSHTPDNDAYFSTPAPAQTVPVNHVVASTRSTDTDMEYRQAFKDYVLKGTPIPAELRSDEQITTSETGYAIPLTLIQQIINTAKAKYGNLYRRARKMPIKGDLQVPITGDDIMMTWITEANPSERKKLNTVGRVLFNRYMAEIKIAQSILSETVTLQAFESYIVQVVAKAFMRTMDYGIVNGTGDGQMLGIAQDARVTNVVTMTAAQMSDWKAWKTRFFANLPAGAEDGSFIFAKSTRITYLETMCDSNGRPIFREAADLTEQSFFGKTIDSVESSIIKDFDTASSGEVVGIFWDPENYWITENADWMVERYKDQDKNQIVTKAIVICDGKVVDPTGFVLIKKA